MNTCIELVDSDHMISEINMLKSHESWSSTSYIIQSHDIHGGSIKIPLNSYSSPPKPTKVLINHKEISLKSHEITMKSKVPLKIPFNPSIPRKDPPLFPAASRGEPGGFLRAEGALCQARGAARAQAFWQQQLGPRGVRVIVLGGSSHLVSGLVHPSYKWINPNYPIYNWGYNPLTKWDEPPSSDIGPRQGS